MPPDQNQRDRQEVRFGQSRSLSGSCWKELYLLPVQGSEAQWYKNVLKNPSIRIDARGVEAELLAPI